MKKIISIILVGAILLGFVAMIGVQTFAESTPELDFDELLQTGSMVGTVFLEQFPGSIAEGQAQLPDLVVNGSEARITQIRWTDLDEQPITAFEKGKSYALEVTLESASGFYFTEDTAVFADNGVSTQRVKYQAPNQVVAYFRYSLLEVVSDVVMQINLPQEGMAFSQLTAQIEGDKAVLSVISVNDPNTGMTIEDVDSFVPNRNYAINYTVVPAEGYQFDEIMVDLEVNGGALSIEWVSDPYFLGFQIYFSTCPEIENVALTLPPVVPGAKLSELVPFAPADANYTVEYCKVIDNGPGEAVDSDTVRADRNYVVEFELVPNEGYVFSEYVQMTVNGEDWHVSYAKGGTVLYSWKQFSFQVDHVELEGLPEDIQPGTASAPQVQVIDDQAKVTQVQWVNADKTPVTTLADGQKYYLAVTLEGLDGRGFSEEMLPECNWRIDDMRVTDSNHAVLYFAYSLEPDVGELRITLSGLTLNSDMGGVTATVNSGNAAVTQVWAEQVEEPYATEGVFEDGSTYLVHIELAPTAGYRFTGESQIRVNSQNPYDYSYNADWMHITYLFSTRDPINLVALGMDEVKVGDEAKYRTPTRPQHAMYSIDYQWYDVTDPEANNEVPVDKFEAGHRYRLNIHIVANDGYRLLDNAEFTVNGAQVEGSIYEFGKEGAISLEYSFLQQINEIKFPAMPTALTVGKAFPGGFKVDSKLPYTMSFEWNSPSGYLPEKVEKGIYALDFVAKPKTGYEFADNVKIYVGGKLVDNSKVYTYADEVATYRLFSAGLKEITKVELSFSMPQPGKAPGKITIPSKANYTLAIGEWAQASDLSVENAQLVEVFTKDYYAFVGVGLEAKDGYAFADNVKFYLNGKLTDPVILQNVGTQNVAAFYLGKVGAVTKKLSAPKLKVSDNVVYWEAVPNAECYDVYRATSKSGKYTKIGTIADTGFVDTSAAATGKVYYYKVKAVYLADTSKNSSYSSAVSVTYKLNPPDISVTNADSGKPVISWQKVDGAKKYTVYRATSEDGKYTKLGTTSKLSYTDSKAKAGSVYYYKVIANASSSKCNSYYSNIEDIGVICGTPSVSVKIDSATGKPSLSWKKVDGATKYAIYRQLPGEEEFTQIKEQTGNSFTDTTAPIDTLCLYKVQALGKTTSVTGKLSKEASATSGIAKPAVKGSVNPEGKPVLTWEPVEGAVKYEVYRSTKSTKGYKLEFVVEEPVCIDTTATAGKTYYYKVKAIGEVSKSADSAYVKLTGKCPAPVISVDRDGASGKPTISWEKISGAKKYTVYRATSEDGKYTKLGTTSKLSYIDSKAKVGTVYYYKVIANASSSKYSSGYSAYQTGLAGCAAPKVTAKNDAFSGKPVLSWKKVDGATEYNIYRLLPGETEPVCIEWGWEKLTFTDETAPLDAKCQYFVQTVHQKEGLSSGLSKAVTVTVKFGKSKPVYYTGIYGSYPEILFNYVEGAVRYEVWRSTKKSDNMKYYTRLSADASTDDGFVDKTTTGGKTYYYKIVAVRENGQKSYSDYVKVTALCGDPELTLGEADSKPVLSWNKIAGAKKYDIYCKVNGGEAKKLTTTTKLTYTHTACEAGNSYMYWVVAVGSKSKYNSDPSNMVLWNAYAPEPEVPPVETPDVMSWAEYMAAEMETPVVVECYVQGNQSWWENKICVYAQDQDGGYYLYDMACSEADAGRLTPGTKIRVSGTKSQWAGQVEIIDATFEFVDDGDTFVAEAMDATDLLGTDALIQHQTEKVAFKGMTVKGIEHKNGEPGDDIYVKLTKDGVDYEFCVERYLTGPETEVYQTVCQLEAGDVVDLEGFLYWYEGPYTHITNVTVVQ